VRVRAAGKRVRVQRVFKKKKLTGPSQTRTRVPVYPPILGHGYGYRGYRTRIYRYGLYPAGFSKPLSRCDLRHDMWFGPKKNNSLFTRTRLIWHLQDLKIKTVLNLLRVLIKKKKKRKAVLNDRNSKQEQGAVL
jgi:hypothetical protein